ncbi:MAG: DUF3987 domain-containing protein, partial [Phycisphaerales bacterium]|nr:DUF3987 domain-containing protein [Phycisphaerales bacterium]
LQAMLAGRKVRDPGDNRTNLYILALAHSGAGKDTPRKMNARILHDIGLSGALAQQIASGEGLEDALLATPSMLVQTDEFDTLLQSMKTSRDGRFESMMAMLLSMYSSASTVHPMRRKANEPEPGVIDQPNLVLFGTAIPNHYYAALSERVMTNGLFARMLIFESASRGPGQEPRVLEPPARVIETAQWWVDLMPGGDLASEHPIPLVVPHDDAARSILIEQREQADDAYNIATTANDAVGAAVWGRANETTRKLALIYAVSESPKNPVISAAAVEWASAVVLHQVRRMLFMANDHAAETPFDNLALKALRRLREAPGGSLPHSVLLKRMKLDAKSFGDVMETLLQRGDVSTETSRSGGRPGTWYTLLLCEKEGEQRGKKGGPESGFSAS